MNIIPTHQELAQQSTTRVVHCKREPFDVLIDRTTKWGNHLYSHKQGTKAENFVPTREAAVAYHYQALITGRLPEQMESLHELENKTLGCWCKPKMCHGDNYVNLINWKLYEERYMRRIKGDESGAYQADFTVLIDSQEKQPWMFTGLKTDADKKYSPLLVPTTYRSLGVGRGDYTLAGYETNVGIERKSCEDLHGTILGWNPPGRPRADESEARSRRERFKSELATLNEYEFAAVVVEATLGTVLRTSPATDTRDGPLNAKYLHRAILSWMQRWPKVQWLFCDDRRLAEVTAYRLLEKFWQHKKEEKKKGK